MGGSEAPQAYLWTSSGPPRQGGVAAGAGEGQAGCGFTQTRSHPDASDGLRLPVR